MLGEVPVREATPYQQPTPPAASPTPPTRILPDRQQQARHEPSVHAVPAVDPNRSEPSRSQRRLQVAGLGLLAGSTVAYAPYLGAALVAFLVLLLRTASVTRQRHGRRRMVRGRAKWYDVPTTTISTPGYLVLALFGSLALVSVASLVALAVFSLGYLFSQPLAPTMTMAGLGFAASLWWGPGSGRVREMVRSLTARTAATEFGGWFVVVMSLLGSAVLLGLLVSSGPNWSPGVDAPWR